MSGEQMSGDQATCGCCTGTTALTPLPTANRPGLEALPYRVGTHATFLETMLARLTTHALPPISTAADDWPQPQRPLHSLTTRQPDDPAIALLDSWATVADVLTFYTERLVNEGYLRTATERRSVLELARLVGYTPRPGVAATAYVAYTLDENNPDEIVITPGTRVQSVPGPGELPQTFETADPLKARAVWNNLKPRQSRPQLIASWEVAQLEVLYLVGISTNLKANDLLLFAPEDAPSLAAVRRVAKVETEPEANRTKVTLQKKSTLSSPNQTPRLTSAAASARLRSLLVRYSDAAAFGVSPERQMTQRVIALLQEWQQRLAESEAFNRLLAHYLPLLQADHQLAVAGDFGRLEPWLDGLLGELEQLQVAVDHTPTAARSATQPSPAEGDDDGECQEGCDSAANELDPYLGLLAKPPSRPPLNPLRLGRDLTASFGCDADGAPKLLALLRPALQPLLYQAWRNTPGPQPFQPVKVYALRVRAAPFGHNAPPRPDQFIQSRNLVINDEWTIDNPLNNKTQPTTTTPSPSPGDGAPVEGPVVLATAATTVAFHQPNLLYLDADHNIQPNSWVMIQKPGVSDDAALKIMLPDKNVEHPSLVAYGLSGKSSALNLGDAKWFEDASKESFSTVRGTVIYAQSEELPLAPLPIDLLLEPIGADPANQIELKELYEGLEAGRWLIITGERADLQSADGTQRIGNVSTSELVMLAGVEQIIGVAEQTHTRLQLAQPLAYTYKRDTVTLYGNVVKATHGETRNEVLGNGDGSKALQSFTLKQPPLTFVPAISPSGVESTLHVRVNDVEWHESASLAALGPTDRSFITQTDDEGKTTVLFGNGGRGARLPTGQANIKAVYRNGIGKPGNVKAKQISLLMDRPLGVREVINPLPASGGADKESRDQARRNAPLAVLALDRLVSVPDYADFARTFAGIGKAYAVRLADGQRQVVHVTIAGADDIPIDPNSDLFAALCGALYRFGDPFQPLQLAGRELLLIVLSARIRVLPDYQWESVAPQVRTALLAAFGFDRRELGQDVHLSELISVIQHVPGVAYVDVEIFGGLPEVVTENNGTRHLITPEEMTLAIQNLASAPPAPHITVNLAAVTTAGIRPAQIAYLTPAAPETLILNVIED